MTVEYIHLSPYIKSTFSLGAAAQVEVGREGEGKKLREKSYKQHDMKCPWVVTHWSILQHKQTFI